MEASNKHRYALYAAGAAAGVATYFLLKQEKSGARNQPTDFGSFLRVVPQAATETAKSTSFESFLRDQPVQPSSTDFASFLRSSGPVQQEQQQQQQHQQAHHQTEAVPEDAVPVLVIYGTEYGFAREISEKLAQQLKDTGSFWPCVRDAAHHPQGMDLTTLQAALLVFSTQGDGVPPSEARQFCDWLAGAGSAAAVSHLAYSVCALGDTSYTHFCRCGKQLDVALAAAGAEQLAPRVDVDKEDWQAVDAWISSVITTLEAKLPGLKTIAELGGPAAAGFAVTSPAAADSSSTYSKSRPYPARVVGVEGLCVLTTAEDKDTVRLRLALSPEAAAAGLAYEPGDALGIWPSNPPQLVDELLAVLEATGEEVVPSPSWHYVEDPQLMTREASGSSGSSSLRHALEVCYDLKSPRAQPLLKVMLGQLQQQLSGAAGEVKPGGRPSFDLQANATTAAAAIPAAAALAGAASTATSGSDDGKVQPGQPSQAVLDSIAHIQQLLSDSEKLEAYLAARHVADILQDFPSVTLTHDQVLPMLRQLQPRLYSISSSPLEFCPGNTAVEATIAVVRYSSLGKQRQGICSTQVAERLLQEKEQAQLLPVFISRNPDFRLPCSASTPLIMVGPGTGLAPFRSFIQQRLLQRQQQVQQHPDTPRAELGAMHLFFGCRRRDQDFIYGQQLQAWHDEGAITLHTAFSRENASKVYVQQRLREASNVVWQLLQDGAHFYVCGDAGCMAGAVETALLEIIAQHQHAVVAGCEAGSILTANDVEPAAGVAAGAQSYLQRLVVEGRYQRDVWLS